MLFSLDVVYQQIQIRLQQHIFCFLLSWSLVSKLMRFGDRNWVVDDSDSKTVEFDRWFWSDSKSMTNPNRRLQFWYKFNLFRYKFDLFWSKDQFKDWKVQWKDQKSPLKDRKVDQNLKNDAQNDKICLFSTIYDKIWSIFDMNRNIFDMNGPDSNPIAATSKWDSWNWIIKLIKIRFESDLKRI